MKIFKFFCKLNLIFNSFGQVNLIIVKSNKVVPQAVGTAVKCNVRYFPDIGIWGWVG